MKEYLTKKNLLIAGAVLLVALLANNARAAEVGMTVGTQSDYIWRGINQSNGPSGNLNLSIDTDSGLYGGFWAGQVEFDGSEATEELDWYAGFQKRIGGVGIDISYTDYGYRGDSSLDFEEVNVGLWVMDDKVHLSHYIGMDDATDYTEVTLYMFEMADISYGFVKDFGSNWKVSKSMELLGGDLEIGYTEFMADDNGTHPDEDGFYLGYSRPLF